MFWLIKSFEVDFSADATSSSENCFYSDCSNPPGPIPSIVSNLSFNGTVNVSVNGQRGACSEAVFTADFPYEGAGIILEVPFTTNGTITNIKFDETKQCFFIDPLEPQREFTQQAVVPLYGIGRFNQGGFFGSVREAADGFYFQALAKMIFPTSGPYAFWATGRSDQIPSNNLFTITTDEGN